MNSQDAERWDARYGADDYLFGTAPSAFVVRSAMHLPSRGHVLCIADGEGRNGAWLAARGLTVSAFDVSRRATEKALKLDAANGVRVERTVAGVETWTSAPGAWHAVVASMVQFAPPVERDAMFRTMRDAIAPGGVAMVHGYTPRQIHFGTGGPRCADHLYTADLLGEAFAGWEMLVLQEYEQELVEGSGHVGRSALIDMVARRPVGAV